MALAITMLIMGFMVIVSVASAQSNPWQWSDISDKLEVRENRPIWASVYAHPYWYLTDGQELYTGGHVWKTDGIIMSDITKEVREAGLNRVDDIVTDGITIIFLKNVVSASRNFEALSYKDGAWAHPAYTWQSRMDSNDSIASINGKNGVWMITTSKGKILFWNQANNAINEITYNDKKSSPTGSALYSVRHSSPVDGHDSFLAPIALPVGDQWLISYLSNNGSMRVWKVKLLNGQSVQSNLEITGQFEPMRAIQAISSNGTQILLASSRYQNNTTNKVYLYDGVTVKDVTTPASGVPFATWNKTLIGHNGKSWMILNGKDLIRFDGSQFVAYGQTRDYFVTISGDKNGRFLLGGAVSAMGIPNPTSPLTAKLVRVDENSGYVAVPAPVQTSNWVWSTMNVSHNQHNLYHGQSSNIYINSGSPYGINRIEIWLNGNVVKTCQSSTCDYTIQGNSYPKGSKIAFNGRAIDNKGHEAWTWLGEYSIPVSEDIYNNSTIFTWFDSNTIKTTLLRNESRNITFYGEAYSGLNRLELYANNELIETCYFNNVYGKQSCVKTIYGNNYSTGQNIVLQIRAIDRNGNQKWSDITIINVENNNNQTNNNIEGVLTITNDHNSGYTNYDQVTFTVNGSDANGINKIEILVNAQVVKTCNGTSVCSYVGGPYNTETVSYGANLYDNLGNRTWTGYKTIYKK